MVFTLLYLPFGHCHVNEPINQASDGIKISCYKDLMNWDDMQIQKHAKKPILYCDKLITVLVILAEVAKHFVTRTEYCRHENLVFNFR